MKPDYNEAVGRYKDTVYKIAFVQCDAKEDAEDVFQEVFLKLLMYNGEFSDDEHLKAWLIRVTINCCKLQKRSAWHRKKTELTENIAADPKSVINDTYYSVVSAIKALPEKYRVIVMMYYYEEYSAREIARALKMNEKTVRTRLFRARNILKQNLQEVWNDD